MPTEELVLRPADEGDAPAVAGIHLSARRAAPMPPSGRSDHEVRRWLRHRLQSTDEVWVAESEEGPVGYVRMSGAGWLDDLYVAPPHAGQGVGSALLDLVKARRPVGFCLWVFESNEVARRFYRRRGLVELERTDGRGNEEQAPDVRMAWPGADPLAFYRGLIDEVDADLGDLLARRAALTAAAQAHKPAGRRDPDRERTIIDAIAARAPALGRERVARIVHAIISESLDAAT